MLSIVNMTPSATLRPARRVVRATWTGREIRTAQAIRRNICTIDPL
jgi:hypothetical protein